MNTLIVGASSGIGRECAHIFAQRGHSIICSARDEEELNRLVADLNVRYDCKALAAPIDLNELSLIGPFIENIFQRINTLDCVVITSATMPSDEEAFFDEDALLTTTMTNYIGVAAVLNEVSRRMMEANGGTIVCLSSIAAARGRQSNFIYSASKSALNTYLQGLRMKAHKHNVHVVTVLPGYVDTLMAYGRVKAALSVSPTYFARKVYSVTMRRKRNIVYVPAIWWLVAQVLKCIPESLYKRLNI